MSSPVLIGDTLHDISRCPHCGVANPLLTTVNKPSLHIQDGLLYWYYVTVRCSKCKDQSLHYGVSHKNGLDHNYEVKRLTIYNSYPNARNAADDIPDRARKYLQQAIDSLHAPDGAVMLAASSVDAMLKDKGYREGSLNTRINIARTDGLLTSEMYDWAHEIRLSANEQRHADDDYEGASQEDAKQVIEFAEALGEYLFVLPARVKKWKALAQKREII